MILYSISTAGRSHYTDDTLTSARDRDTVSIISPEDPFGRDRDGTICAGSVWTGTDLQLSRDCGIVPNPVKSRGKNPEDCPGAFGRFFGGATV